MQVACWAWQSVHVSNLRTASPIPWADQRVGQANPGWVGGTGCALPRSLPSEAPLACQPQRGSRLRAAMGRVASASHRRMAGADRGAEATPTFGWDKSQIAGATAVLQACARTNQCPIHWAGLFTWSLSALPPRTMAAGQHTPKVCRPEGPEEPSLGQSAASPQYRPKVCRPSGPEEPSLGQSAASPQYRPKVCRPGGPEEPSLGQSAASPQERGSQGTAG
jgi:hypothetical protein